MAILEDIKAKLLGGKIRAILIEPVTGEQVTFNATLAFNENSGSEVTKHAIEEGAPLTDNIRILSPTISVSIQLSNEQSIVGAGILETNIIGAQEGSVIERAARIKGWRKDKKLLSLWHEDLFENIVIINIDEDKGGNLGDAKNYDIELEQINIAKGEILDSSDKGQTDKIEPPGPVASNLDAFKDQLEAK